MQPVRASESLSLTSKAEELREGKRTVRLQKQTSQVLGSLVNHRGEVVLREESRKRFWPNEPVVEFDQAIHTTIKKLCQALDDPADKQKIIQTVECRGTGC